MNKFITICGSPASGKRGKYKIEGHFEQPELMSNNLRQKLLQFGAPMDLLDRFMQKGADYA